MIEKKEKIHYPVSCRENASCLKALTIDYWLSNNSADLIINEVPFFKGNRRADLVIIQGNYLIGFEIKSELDSLNKLNTQIDDYIKIFDKVYIVIAEKFKNHLEIRNLPKSVGILVKKQTLQSKKEARQIKKFKKNDLLSILWRRDLEHLINKKGLDIECLKRKVISDVKLEIIKKEIIVSLKKRYGKNYALFLRDRGNYTTVEDLKTITRINKNTYFS